MRIEFEQHADPGVTFARDAFDSAIGTRQTVVIGGVCHEAPLVAAKVADDGTSVRLTIELSGDAQPLPMQRTRTVPPTFQRRSVTPREAARGAMAYIRSLYGR